MKQLFKTSLLAATIAATCGTAFAGEVTVTTQTHSKEGLLGLTVQQTSNAITYEMGAGYLPGDKITFTFPEDSVVLGTFPTTLSLPATDGDNDTAGGDGVDAIAGVALGQSGSTSNSVTYRVLSVTQPQTTLLYDAEGNLDVTGNPKTYTAESSLGNVVDLGAIGYVAASLLDADVTVTVSAKDAIGDIIDNSADSKNTGIIATAKSQFGSITVGVTPEDAADPANHDTVKGDMFDGTIDVGSARTNFISGNTDMVDYVVSTVDTTGWLNLATVDDTVITLWGDTGKMTDLDETNFSTGRGATEAFTEAEAKLVLTYTGMVTNDTVTFTADPSDNVVLQEQSFEIDAIYNYDSVAGDEGVAVLGAGKDAGSWELNGASVNIPYMPYSDTASQIIYVTNASELAGEITVTAFDGAGNTYDLGAIGMANGNTVTKITSLVKTALEAKGFTAGKVSLTVTVNAKADDITVYASYNAGSVRGFVNTDQYKGIKDN